MIPEWKNNSSWHKGFCFTSFGWPPGKPHAVIVWFKDKRIICMFIPFPHAWHESFVERLVCIMKFPSGEDFRYKKCCYSSLSVFYSKSKQYFSRRIKTPLFIYHSCKFFALSDFMVMRAGCRYVCCFIKQACYWSEHVRAHQAKLHKVYALRISARKGAGSHSGIIPVGDTLFT